MKVVFLFNFSPEVGGGHFKRCSNLALKFLENNAKVFFITNEHNVLKSFASKKKIKIFTKKKNKSNEFNIDQNVKILKKIKKIDLLIIDDYEIHQVEYHMTLRHYDSCRRIHCCICSYF